jgi:hypothetical protein
MMDPKVTTRMKILVGEAAQHGGPAVFTLVNGTEYRFFTLGALSDFDIEMRESLESGFKPLCAIALCFTEDRKPLIEDEPMDGADPKQVKAARQLFVEECIAKGILKADGPKG